MKKFVKFLPVIFVFLILFSAGVFAADSDIVLPEAPKSIEGTSRGKGFIGIMWDEVEGADGYDVYLKENGKWIHQSTTVGVGEYVYNLISNSEYEVGVKSYIIVDGIKYQSKKMCTGIIATSTIVPSVILKAESVKNGIKLTWETAEGISGYRLYVVKNGKWTKIKDIYGKDKSEYIYTDVKIGTKYKFGIKAFAKGSLGLKFSFLMKRNITHADVMKVKITSNKKTSSTITLYWKKVQGAKGYRVYIYRDKKWKAVKTLTATSYKVTDLQASTKYKFKVRGYEKVKGKTKWYPYSEVYSAVTGSKTVKASRVKNLQKYFSDGDWLIKIKNMKDDTGNTFIYTVAGKGKDLLSIYDYGNKNVAKYLYLDKKEKVYAIDTYAKKYSVLSDEQAYYMFESMYAVSEILKVQNVGKVTAKTSYYNGKTAVAETYTDKVYGVKKTYYFVNDKVVGIKLKYSDGSVEEYDSFSVTNTPSSSLFKVPSNYKKVN